MPPEDIPELSTQVSVWDKMYRGAGETSIKSIPSPPDPYRGSSKGVEGPREESPKTQDMEKEISICGKGGEILQVPQIGCSPQVQKKSDLSIEDSGVLKIRWIAALIVIVVFEIFSLDTSSGLSSRV
ncbi:hypothetical protein AB205_0182680 [Aquarana catesbeiana]|uniref:Uncharacterized protein n=1 Tax=Aquarana catesbeiana TaxID=8400 RepID=A0A2G9RIK9_AQUCT|nr:hypothetical protein AB205_0182680 [Aquarana catesbeiana]